MAGAGSKSRDKGARAETAVRNILTKSTGMEWLRVPGSGAFGASHQLKGDIYLAPATGKFSAWTIEVKHYKDEHFNSHIFKPAVSQLDKWLDQTYREAEEMNAKPMLVFKKDMGLWLVAVDLEDIDYAIIDDERFTYSIFQKNNRLVVIMGFEQWVATMTPEDFVK